MLRSRGTLRSRAPSTPTPTSPDESFIRKRFSSLHRGDVKTLAASSIAVASSIGSPSLNQSCPPDPHEQNATHISRSDHNTIGQGHHGVDSAWQTAYSMAKMVVDITKESSDMFLPLKAVVGALSVLIKNYDKTMGNARQVEEIEERVSSLSDILRSPLKEDDHLERARRELLCRRLMDVLEKLEPLSEQNGMLKFLRNEDRAGLLNGFVQDMFCAVMDYQTSLQQSTYENTRDVREVARGIHEVSRNIDRTTRGIAEDTVDIVHKTRDIIEATDLETLDKLDPVHNAGYQAEHHECCLSGTRESILEDIMRWAQNAQDQPVYWLNGLAGTGKSTIAQTFSEMARDCNVLGASFFCSRDYLDRKILKNIFPTIAYQLACRYPRFRDHLVKVIRQDPSVAHNSLISQLRDLLVDPLSATGISCVIVIDALDECVDDQPASAILSVLGRLVSKLPLVKFFITGRPEPRIRSGFRLPLMEPFTQVFLLHEVDSTSVGGDIRLYLTEKLTGIAKRRSGLDLPEAWPSDEDITVLVKKSSGLFIFASTVARFIESEHHEPRERLRLIVGRADDTSHEGASGIDSLYSQVLRDAFFGINEGFVFVDLKHILSAVVLALNPLSRDGLMQLLNINSAIISTRLRHLHSVLLVPADGAKEIRVFHKSFPDFLQDSDRCRDSRFHIDCSTRHGDMALSCLGLVGKLEINPCALPPFAMNEDVPNRQQLLMDKLGSGLRYACKYWTAHLLLSSSSGEYGNRLITATSLFFNRTLFPWMEIMSLEDHLEGVIHSMNNLLDWSGKDGVAGAPLLDLTTDCLRFTLHFFRPIQASARHIYHTALPLSPESSILRSRLFENRSSSEEHLTTRQTSSSNIPTTWGPILRTIKADSGGFAQVAVAGQRIVAVCEDNTVNVYDAVTGVLKLSLNPPQRVKKAEGSPDGSVLFFAHQRTREITVWDTQTGGLVHTLTMTSNINNIAVSSKGKYLGTSLSDDTFEFWEVESRRRGSHSLGQAVVSICWLEPEEKVALALKQAVVILEVITGRRLHTCLVYGDSVREIASLAGKHQLAVSSAWGTKSIITTIDTQTGSELLRSSPQTGISCFAFSGNGSRVFCATNTGNLLSFDTFTISFEWNRYLSRLGTIHSMSPLRSGHLAVNFGGSIQLLESEYTQPPATNPGQEIAHVYRMDTDRTISVYSKHHENVSLLDVKTMKTLVNHRVNFDELGVLSPFPPRFLCASIDRHIAVLRLRETNGFTLNLYDTNKVHKFVPIWEQISLRPVLLGTLSPTGTTLITVGDEDPSGGGDWELCVWSAVDGEILNATPFIRKGRPPYKITFTSKTQFYTEDHWVSSSPPRGEDVGDYANHDVQTTSTLPTTSKHSLLHPGALDTATPRTWSFLKTRSIPRTSVSKQPEVSSSQSRTGVHRKKYRVRKTFSLRTVKSRLEIKEESGEEILPANHYALDDNLEWVVDAESRRVCWLPPGYVTGVEDGHCFVGSSIVMIGQDGIVRNLMFSEPRVWSGLAYEPLL